MAKKDLNPKARKGWVLEKFHSFADREQAEKYPAHIGGGKTPILPALPKKEKWRAEIPEDFGTVPYTFGFTDKYPTPSDKQIIREIQIRKFAKQLAKKLKRKEGFPKDTMMKHAQDKDYIEEFKRAMGDPKEYSLEHLAYPEGFKYLPLPPDRGKYEDKRGLIKRR